MVGCCGCFSKKNRVKRGTLSNSISSVSGPDKLKEFKGCARSIRSDRSEQVELQVRSVSTGNSSVRPPPSELSEVTVNTSSRNIFIGPQQHAGISSDIKSPIPESPYPTKGQASNCRRGKDASTELSSTEKLFLKYKMQLTKASLNEELRDLPSSESSLDKPLRSFNTPRYPTNRGAKKRFSDLKSESRKKGYDAPTQNYLIRKYDLPTYPRLSKTEIPPGYGPPEGALKTSSRRKRSVRSPIVSNNTVQRTGAESIVPTKSAGAPKPNQLKLFKKISPLEGATVNHLNDCHSNSEVKEGTAPPSPQSGSFTVSKNTSPATSERSGSPSPASNQTNSITPSEISENETPNSFNSLFPTPPSNPDPAFGTSGSFNTSSTPVAAITATQPANVLFKHGKGPSTAKTFELNPSVTSLETVKQNTKRPYNSETSMDTKKTQQKPKGIDYLPRSCDSSLSLSRVKLARPQRNSGHSSLTSFPETEVAIEKTTKPSSKSRYRQKSNVVNETLNRILRDLKRQSRVLKQYKKVLQKYQPPPTAPSRHKSKAQQTRSSKTNPISASMKKLDNNSNNDDTPSKHLSPDGSRANIPENKSTLKNPDATSHSGRSLARRRHRHHPRKSSRESRQNRD